jgi:hypothetical protein
VWLLQQLQADPAWYAIVVRQAYAASVRQVGLQYLLAGKVTYDVERDV